MPYGVTGRNEWDITLPVKPLFQQLRRIIKPNGVIAMTAIQPFSSRLVVDNLEYYRYSWYWNKVSPTGFLNSKNQPLRCVEEILIFSKEKPAYNPQMQRTKQFRKKGGYSETNNYGKYNAKYITENNVKFPKNLITISNADKSNSLHPTQKPVELFEYFIKTYTKENDVVLDCCFGSGTTAVACKRLNRNFIGYEISKKYVDVANSRLKALPEKLDMFTEVPRPFKQHTLQDMQPDMPKCTPKPMQRQLLL